MPIHLVRHAHAGKRSQWDGDDRERPLSDRGEAQAGWLADLLATTGVTKVISSPYARCMQTVEPLATRLGVEIEPTPELAEGADVDTALGLVMALDPHHGIACSHGDLIPHILRRLKAEGMEIDGPLLDQKGSVWVLDVEKGRARRGHYVPPGV